MANLIDSILDFFNGGKQAQLKTPVVEQKKVNNQNTSLPPLGGRTSVTEAANLYTSLKNLMKPPVLIPSEYIEAMEFLSIWNPDFSHAVANLVELGVTPHEIKINGASESLSKKAIQHIKDNRDKWYSNGDGFNGLLMDLFRQVVCTGAVSAERIPKSKPLLSGIDSIVLVSPATIEFLYDSLTYKFRPYQKPKNSIGADLNTMGLVELSDIQYVYIGMQRVNDNPEAIPPLLSALKNSNINDDIISQLSFIAKKYGILGLLSMLVAPPALMDGESYTDETYMNRAIENLSRYRAEIEKGFKNGILLGYKDNHEFKVESSVHGGQGVKEVFNVNDTQFISGLKTDPTLLGRDAKTSEAFAKVSFKILRSRIKSFQDVVANFIANTYLFELQMAGFPISSLSVEFESVDMEDKLAKENAEGKKIENVLKKLDSGIISPDAAAQELGYEKAFNPNIKKPSENQTPLKLINFNFEKKQIERLEVKRKCRLKTFDYFSNEKAGCTSFSDGGFTFNDDSMQGLFSDYTGDVSEQYSNVIESAAGDMAESLTALNAQLTEVELFTKVMYHVLLAFETGYNIKGFINKYIDKGYNKFRKDKKVLNGKKDVKAAVLTLPDLRALNYFKESDKLYLGKFITDPDTVERLTKFIKDEYLMNGGAITHNPEAIQRFRASLVKHLTAENWKIDRVIATTVNRMRAYGAISYMAQENVEWFEIRGVNDKKQCAYCSDMQGRRFSVSMAFEKISHIVEGDPSNISDETPFITSVFKTASGMQGLSDIEIQNKGVSTPPYHPFCRDVVLAVID